MSENKINLEFKETEKSLLKIASKIIFVGDIILGVISLLIAAYLFGILNGDSDNSGWGGVGIILLLIYLFYIRYKYYSFIHCFNMWIEI